MTSRLLVDKIEGKTTASTVQMPSGSILQMQTGQLAGSSSQSSSTSYTDTQLSVNITPKFATSKIFVLTNQQVGVTKSTVQLASAYYNARIDMKLLENNSATILAQSVYCGLDDLQYGNMSVYHSQHGIFQCSNTNQLTFKTQVRLANGSTNGGAAIFPSWYTGSIHNITAMEIAQ